MNMNEVGGDGRFGNAMIPNFHWLCKLRLSTRKWKHMILVCLYVCVDDFTIYQDTSNAWNNNNNNNY